MGALFGAAVSVTRKDMDRLTQLLVDAEMKMFHGLRTPGHLPAERRDGPGSGPGNVRLFRDFARDVKGRYGAEPGFISMNTASAADALEKVGVDNPIICSNINKIGFQDERRDLEYEHTMATRRFRPIAMSVFASARFRPRKR